MLDRTPRHRELQTGFKMFCEKLITREGFLVMEAGWKQKNARNLHAGIDLVVKRPSDPDMTVVEAKFYRSRLIDPALIRNALEEIKKFRDAKKAKAALLIITAEISAGLKAEALKQDVTIWDLTDILQLTVKTPTLADGLGELLREGDFSAAQGEQFFEELVLLDEQSPRQKGKAEGARLIGELDAVKPGREGARKFEQLCDKAMRYLLSDQFHRWNTQVTTEDGFNRPDLLARLVPRHAFWVGLSEDFRSRYVVFAFKNTAEPLPHGEIFSVETYLHAGALRMIALVVARAGIDAGARRACQLALRERGKLVLCLTLAELREMLAAKDSGDEYNDILIERAGELLTDLSP